MDESKLITISNNNLNRWLIGRNYWYLFRRLIDGKYVCHYNDSKLLDELLDIYNNLPKDIRNTYIQKDSKKAK